jgi:hypothetical protein
MYDPISMPPIYEWQSTSLWVAGTIAGGALCLLITFTFLAFPMLRNLAGKLRRAVVRA